MVDEPLGGCRIAGVDPDTLCELSHIFLIANPDIAVLNEGACE